MGGAEDGRRSGEGLVLCFVPHVSTLRENTLHTPGAGSLVPMIHAVVRVADETLHPLGHEFWHDAHHRDARVEHAQLLSTLYIASREMCLHEEVTSTYFSAHLAARIQKIGSCPHMFLTLASAKCTQLGMCHQSGDHTSPSHT